MTVDQTTGRGHPGLAGGGGVLPRPGQPPPPSRPPSSSTSSFCEGAGPLHPRVRAPGGEDGGDGADTELGCRGVEVTRTQPAMQTLNLQLGGPREMRILELSSGFLGNVEQLPEFLCKY